MVCVKLACVERSSAVCMASVAGGGLKEKENALV